MQDNKPLQNSHRSLRELVSVDAWFARDPEDVSRLTLHADVSFREERLSGSADTDILFKIAVKRCDVVFCPPSGPMFRIDPASVAKPRPKDPRRVEYKDKRSTSTHAKGTLSVKPSTISGELGAGVAHNSERETSEEGLEETSYYNELWLKTREGFHAWSVDGRELSNSRLLGPVIDGTSAPRLTLIDGRSEEARRLDADRQMDPISSIYVRCRREDLDVYDIRFKDEKRQVWFDRSKGKREKELVAREVIKIAIFEEGLEAGDIVNDPYAEMRICDVAIPIIEQSS